MRKALVFLKKKDGISRDEFIDYYENTHVPLIRELLPSISEYRRNYLNLDATPSAHGRTNSSAHPGFDVVTEIWFTDEEAFEAFVADIGRPEMAARIAEDELNFLDRSANRTIGVDEFIAA
jgi:uncharacterized protein (TIGR02118 family)